MQELRLAWAGSLHASGWGRGPEGLGDTQVDVARSGSLRGMSDSSSEVRWMMGGCQRGTVGFQGRGGHCWG